MSGVSSVPGLVWVPTATTVPSLRAVTPNSELDAVPGFGLRMIVQLVPSQCSVSVAKAPVLSWSEPTAQMSLAEIAAIPSRELLRAGLEVGFGLETMLQLVPSQC
jgi:hypothetical protein